MTQFLISREHTLTCMYTITILNACFLESIRKLYFNHTEKRSGCTALDGIKFNYYTYYVLIVFLAVYDKKKTERPTLGTRLVKKQNQKHPGSCTIPDWQTCL